MFKIRNSVKNASASWLQRVCAHTARKVISCQILAGAVALLSLPLAVQAGPLDGWGAHIYFAGWDRAHIKIIAPYTDFMELVRRGPGPGDRVTVWYGVGPLTNELFEADLAPGHYDYVINESFYQGSVDVPAAFSGTLLKSEVYESCSNAVTLSNPGMLTIPDGMSFTLRGVTLLSNDTFSADGAGNLIVDGTRFGSSVSVTGTGSFVFNNTVFPAGVHVSGPNKAFSRSTFYGDSMAEDTDALFSHNAFCGTLGVHTSGLHPLILNNSFLGQNGLYGILDNTSDMPVDLGNNYYGDSQGPVTNGMPTGFYLCQGGATVSDGAPAGYHALKMTGYSASGDERDDKSVFPAIWCNGVVVLQQTTSLLRQGLPWMVSVDLRCWDKALSGVRVVAQVDGVSHAMTPVTVCRDPLSAVGYSGLRNGQSTFNITLPPVNTNTVDLKVIIDTTGVSGYSIGGGSVMTQASYSLDFSPGFARPLRIMVAPWEIRCPGYSTATPGAGAAISELRARICKLFPIKQAEVVIEAQTPGRYNAGYGALAEGLFSTVLADRLLLELHAYLTYYNASLPAEMNFDRLIAVVPDGVLGTKAGMAGSGAVNAYIDGRICLIEQSASDAVLHELGHTMGLYTGISGEQYGSWNYSPNGIVISNQVSFDVTGGSIDAAPLRVWRPWLGGGSWYDFMGRTNPFWIIPDEFHQVYQALSGLLGPSSAGALSKKNVGPKIGPAGGMANRLIWFRGSVLGGTQLVAGSISAIDQTGQVGDDWPRGDIGSYWEGYKFIAYDASSNELATSGFYIQLGGLLAQNTNLDHAIWQRRFEYPAAATRLVIKGDILNPNPGIYWETTRLPGSGDAMLSAPEAFGCSITTPAPGTILGDIVQLAWQTSGAGAAPVRHRLYVSTDGGTSWIPKGDMLSETNFDLETMFLPSGNPVSIMVLSSDGLNTATGRVDALTLGNRPPVVSITSPVMGDRATTNTLWKLEATAVDIEDGLLEHGVWRSSLAGILGTNTTLPDVALPAGAQALTFVATDSGGLTSSACVTVVVGNLNLIDLKVPTQALKVEDPGEDPGAPGRIHLEPGQTNTISLKIRNEGADGNTTASLLLYATAPGGTETLIQSQQLSMAAFELAGFSLGYIPQSVGLYQFRAALTNLSPADTNPANNVCIWSVPSGLGDLLVHLDPSGAQWALDDGPWQTSDTTLSNVVAGVHMAHFSSVAGYITPANRELTVESGRTTVYGRQYEPLAASLRVTLQPQQALVDGAQWALDGGAWHGSGETASNLVAGSHQLAFKDLPWFIEPATQWVMLVSFQTLNATGTYSALPRPPPKATDPFPPDGSTNWLIDTTVYWSGTDYWSSRTFIGTTTNLTEADYVGSVNGLPVTGLRYATPYYWRVDLSNAVGVTTGSLWRFTTESMPPLITSGTEATGEVGCVFQYRITASNATGYGVESLPAWLTQRADGTLRGICNTAGVYMATLFASNSATYRAYPLGLLILGGANLEWAGMDSGTNVTLNGITYGNGQFVAVGAGGVILASSNGSTWVRRSVPVSNTLNAVTYGTNGYVTVGSSGVILKSLDTVTWTVQTSTIPTTLYGVTYGTNRYVAVGSNLVVLTSTDGTVWTNRNSGVGVLSGVAYGSNVFSCVGGRDSSSMTGARSINGGDIWFNAPLGGNNGHFGVAYGRGNFVAVGRNGSVRTSPTAISWTAASSYVSDRLEGICFGVGQFVAVGANGAVLSSRDGSTWRPLTSGVSAGLHGVAYGPRRFVAVGDGGAILMSPYEPDSDGDHFPDWVELSIGTDPMDPDSLLRIDPPTGGMCLPGNQGFVIQWPSISGRLYTIQRSVSLLAQPFNPLATVTGRPTATTYTDITAAATTTGCFYRIQTEP